METIFTLSSLLVMPFWLLMIFLPHWRWTRRIIASWWIITPIALLYLLLALPLAGQLLPALANPTLGMISEALGEPAGATIAWAHFLAFDLFVGRWIYLDNQTRGISAWIIVPVLFMTLMMGPIGFLLYQAIVLFKTRTAVSSPL